MSMRPGGGVSGETTRTVEGACPNREGVDEIAVADDDAGDAGGREVAGGRGVQESRALSCAVETGGDDVHGVVVWCVVGGIPRSGVVDDVT